MNKRNNSNQIKNLSHKFIEKQKTNQISFINKQTFSLINSTIVTKQARQASIESLSNLLQQQKKYKEYSHIISNKNISCNGFTKKIDQNINPFNKKQKNKQKDKRNDDIFKNKLIKNSKFSFDNGHQTPQLRYFKHKKLSFNSIDKELSFNSIDCLNKAKSSLQYKQNDGNRIKNIGLHKNMFEYLYIIGKGGFGKVWKVKDKKTKKLYAMKQMLKAIVMSKQSIESIMNQRIILSKLSSSFLVNMHFSFQNRNTLFLALDLMEGADLRYHLGRNIFNQQQTKFFIACIIVGLEDLKNHSIIHRDLKPENIVLDSKGYLRITDFGVARIYRPNNHVDTSGTPGYMAPEVICRQNHSFVSDYFGLGVIAYEIITGKRPYNGKSRAQIRNLMLSKEVQLQSNELKKHLSDQCLDFINNLIKRKAQYRLGYNGIQQLKNHAWFSQFNWQKLRQKKMQSPYIPKINKQDFDQDQLITIQNQQEAQKIAKNHLLLKKRQIQKIFQSYQYQRGKYSICKQFQKNPIKNTMIQANNKYSFGQIKRHRKSTLIQKRMSTNLSKNNEKSLNIILQKIKQQQKNSIKSLSTKQKDIIK